MFVKLQNSLKSICNNWVWLFWHYIRIQIHGIDTHRKNRYKKFRNKNKDRKTMAKLNIDWRTVKIIKENQITMDNQWWAQNKI